MGTVFADATYWIAMSNPRDSLHTRAKELSRSHQSMRLVTSEMVLTEFLDDYCHRGEFFRKAAVAAVERLWKTSNVRIIPQTSAQFRDALTFYAARRDKTWSLTDYSELSEFGSATPSSPRLLEVELPRARAQRRDTVGNQKPLYKPDLSRYPSLGWCAAA